MSQEEKKTSTEYSEDLAISVKGLKKMYKLYNMPSDRLLDAFGLKKHNYKEHYALNGVDIDIKKGETIGIIGTNGSGKSTMLKIITGVLNPTDVSLLCWNSEPDLTWNTTALKTSILTAP